MVPISRCCFARVSNHRRSPSDNGGFHLGSEASIALKPTILTADALRLGADSSSGSAPQSGWPTAAINGVRWRVNPVQRRLVEQLSETTLAAPEKHGWKLVKRNPLRDVWCFVLAGESYFAKCFRRGWRDTLRRQFGAAPWLAEWRGGLYAAATRIAAPEMIALAESIRVGGQRCALLISRDLGACVPLNSFWRALVADPDVARGRADARQVMSALADMLARAHQGGFEHRDLHPENIVVQTVGVRCYQTAFVDLQCVRHGVSVSDAAVVRNLALLNQWFRRHARITDRLRFLRFYMRQRLEYEAAFPQGRRLGLRFEELVAALVQEADRHAEQLWAGRDRRCLRANKYFAKLRQGSWRGMAFLESKERMDDLSGSATRLTREWWQTCLREPLKLLGGSGAQCKDSHSALVARVQLHTPDGGVLPAIVKRPRARNWRRALRQWFGPSRSARAWRTAYALLHRDLAAARPLAYVERRLGPLVRDSLVLVEAIPDADDLETCLKSRVGQLTPRAAWTTKLELVRLLARHLRLFHERRFMHRDCKASNMLVSWRPRLRLVWIDMDGIRHPPRVALTDELQALARLYVSVREISAVTRTDCFRFLRLYFGRYGSDRNAPRAAWQAIARLAATKVAALTARRQWKQAHYGRY